MTSISAVTTTITGPSRTAVGTEEQRDESSQWSFNRVTGSASRKGDNVNVIFISMDTLRSDRLGCLGHERGLTPNLDRIAGEGSLFTNAFASDIPTQPSHTAIFTGKFGSRPISCRISIRRPAWTPTSRGCRRSFATPTSNGRGHHLFAMKDWFLRGYTDYMPPPGRSRSPGSVIVDMGTQWLDEHRKEAFFLFLHFWDPHTPYLPPQSYKKPIFAGILHVAWERLGGAGAGFSTGVRVAGVSEPLDGAARPHHFGGVATVVTKLLVQCAPDLAVFGEKDYQQLQVIRRLVADLDLPVRIIGGPIVRAESGLALSSRNAYLSDIEREVAERLNVILAAAIKALRSGVQIASVEATGLATLEATGFDRVDYFEVPDAETLARLGTAKVVGPARQRLGVWHLGIVRCE